MERIEEVIRQLTGAVNAQIEQIKKIEQRLTELENPVQPTIANNASVPRSEQDLRDISKLPDCVKELQVFDGNPVEYISWIHNVESILEDYEIVRHKPLYRAILQSIRRKVRGNADAALISFNIFDDDWSAIKKCLSLHYADKRDLRTLEHQLSNFTQRNKTVDEFYANVNHQFNLIFNKIKTEDYSSDTVQVLIETYRNRALDVFIRGLNGELAKMLMIQRPQTLPEAYTSCLEIQNLNFRNVTLQKTNINNRIVAPINQIPRARFEQTPINRNFNQIPIRSDQRNNGYNVHQNQPPPRPTQQKPPTPMEIDRSIQSRQANYINRPNMQNTSLMKTGNGFYSQTQKPLIHHIETQNNEPVDNFQENNDQQDAEYTQMYNSTVEPTDDEEITELNFMIEASQAYPT